MKNEIRFTLELKQRPKLVQEIGNILGTAPHYNGYQAVHMILQDNDWTNRVYCIFRREQRKKRWKI